MLNVFSILHTLFGSVLILHLSNAEYHDSHVHVYLFLAQTTFVLLLNTCITLCTIRCHDVITTCVAGACLQCLAAVDVSFGVQREMITARERSLTLWTFKRTVAGVLAIMPRQLV